MIPLKLTLENFKCYRSGVPTLHLQGVHIACLCGPNGNGKSSLLDAMTWALWGDAVHRPQEELVHIGEQDMRVELEFIAGGPSTSSGQALSEGQARGQHYRVIGRYARGRGARAGATDLQLQVAVRPFDFAQGRQAHHERENHPAHPEPVEGHERDEGTDSPLLAGSPRRSASEDEGSVDFRSISGNSVRETEASIEKLVGMDYTTFVNSAFLVQGRADEFTTKRPAERQRVLGEILGLGFYDRLQERARQKARSCATEMQRIEGQVQAWTQEMTQRPEHEAELPEIEAALSQASEELATAEQGLATTREQVSSLRERQRELSDLERNRDTEQEELRQLQVQKAQHERRVQEWEALSAREQEINQGFARLTELRGRDEELNRLHGPYERLQERKRPLAQRADALPSLEADLATAQRGLVALKEREDALQARREELQEMEVTKQTLQSENQRLRQEMDGLRSKVDMLSGGDARCPLCGTELGVEGREHIAKEYEAQGTALAQQYRQNQAAMGELEPRYRETAVAVQGEEREVEESRRQLHGRTATLTQQVEEARKAPGELDSVEKELDSLGYDPAAHQQVKESLAGLAPFDEEHRRLQEATRGLPEERENLQRVAALAQRREEAIRQSEERIATVRTEVVELPALEQQLRDAEGSWASIQQRHQQLVARRGFLEERLREYGETERKKAEAESRQEALGQEREVFEQLAIAFGRTGVQALLVEAAIPDLEAEANRLLGRMTDNTMNLKLETQRETQRGEPVETLDIKVADSLGTRSYETFSGGEAFRINLALRIALSRLLAHRAGAPLPTLFIDEGFGTQDAAGRERILDVIQSIADDFERILVITHMEEVKDAFPVRIEVEKTGAGATFSLT